MARVAMEFTSVTTDQLRAITHAVRESLIAAGDEKPAAAVLVAIEGPAHWRAETPRLPVTVVADVMRRLGRDLAFEEVTA